MHPGGKITITGKDFKKEPTPTIRLTLPDKSFYTEMVNGTVDDDKVTHTLPKCLKSDQSIEISVINDQAEVSNKLSLATKPAWVTTTFRLGLESSTNNVNSTDTKNSDGNEKLFHDNRLFYEIAAKMRISPNIDLVSRLHLGRSLVQGESTIKQNEEINEIVANAESAEGEISFLFKWTKEEVFTGFYLRPHATFITSSDESIKDDAYFDKGVMLGYCPQNNVSVYGSSFVELGYAHTDALSSEDRFRALIHLSYDNGKLKHIPFADVSVDAGNGPDNISIIYGVNLDIESLFSSIESFFFKKKTDENKDNG
ncbi:MAG: hypothetical protein C0621_06385 [Desulfuromonas sp.]|nr:MAG: hypothetical protein C0621_06385 [Desulfuromonas sp.]